MSWQHLVNWASAGLCALAVVGCGAGGGGSPTYDTRMGDSDSSGQVATGELAPEARGGTSQGPGASAPGGRGGNSPSSDSRPGRVVFAPLQVGTGNDYTFAAFARADLEAIILRGCGGEMCLNLVTQVVASDSPDVECHQVAVIPRPAEGLMVDRGSTVVLQIGGKGCGGVPDTEAVSPSSTPDVTGSPMSEAPTAPPTEAPASPPSEAPVAPTDAPASPPSEATPAPAQSDPHDQLTG